MENQTNKSIDNLKNEAVKGEEIKGGSGVLGGMPNLPSGHNPIGPVGDLGSSVLEDPNTALGNHHNPGVVMGADGDILPVLPNLPG